MRKPYETSKRLEVNTVLEFVDNLQVASSSDYDIYNIYDNVNKSDCKISCTDCLICIHRYVCNQMEYVPTYSLSSWLLEAKLANGNR